MATKAQRAKVEEQRAGQAANANKRTSRSATGATKGGRAEAKGTAPTSHNAAPRAARNSAYELEVVAPSTRPSRKSTRKSPTHVKPDAPMRNTTMMARVASPRARAQHR